MSENALDVLAARVAALERRLDQLEGLQGPVAPATNKLVEAPAPSLDATLIGKSVLIVGGGYLLRALTELHLLDQRAGIALGFLYALFWIFMADRALRRGRAINAWFEAGTGSLIAAGLIWETTTRFHFIDASVASVLVVCMAIALLVVAWRERSDAIALIAVVLTSVTSIGVALGTAQIVAPLLAATLVGIYASRFAVLALTSDSLAASLIVITLFSQSRPSAPAEIALIVYALAWIAGPRWQSIGAAVVGFAGAAAIAQFHNGDVIAVGVVLIAIAVALLIRRRDDLSTVAAFLGTLLVFEPFALAMLWATLAVACALTRKHAYAAFWILAASIASGLPVALVKGTEPSLIAALIGAIAAAILWLSRSMRLVFLTIATATSIAVIIGGLGITDHSIAAMARTVVLSIAAMVLAAISTNLPEAKTLSRVLLVLVAAKLLVEDLPAGRAVTIVIALALYGIAIVIVARAAAVPAAVRESNLN